MASAQGHLLICTKVPLSKVLNPSCFIRSQCPVVQDWSVLGSFQWLTAEDLKMNVRMDKEVKQKDI